LPRPPQAGAAPPPGAQAATAPAGQSAAQLATRSAADVAAPGAAPPSRVVLALSKTDTLREKSALLPLIAEVSARYPFAAIIPVSAARGWQLDDLFAVLRALLPVGLPLFDAEDITDRSVRFLAAELVREQAFRLLGDELPYGLAVAIESWEESPGRALISAQIVVERESQRGIVVGAGGAKLREIGSKARGAIERLLEKKVFLETHVRVAAGWSDDARALDRLGVESVASRGRS
jgi:GTP-binding protein Era